MKLPIATFYPANPANYDKGRQGNAVDRITVHHTAGMESTLKALYENPKRQGSAHFFVHPQKIEQYVDTDDTAWTNGNYSSNLRAITIEVRGDWRGYYDQPTLDNLRRLFAALRGIYPNARLTYHMDESTKATACPADLKHKGYALKEWNAAATIINPPTSTGGSEVANASQVNNLYKAILHREGDPGGIKNYTGRDANSIVAEMLGSAEFQAHQNFINTASQTIQAQLEAIRSLSENPTKAELQKYVSEAENARSALSVVQAELEELQKNPQVVEKEVLVETNPRWLESVIQFLRKVLRIN